MSTSFQVSKIYPMWVLPWAECAQSLIAFKYAHHQCTRTNKQTNGNRCVTLSFVSKEIKSAVSTHREPDG